MASALRMKQLAMVQVRASMDKKGLKRMDTNRQ